MIAKQILRAVHEVGLTAGISIICVANVNGQSIHPPIGTPLPDPPQVVNSFELQLSMIRQQVRAHFSLRDMKSLPW
jgi:hypothetical protein